MNKRECKRAGVGKETLFLPRTKKTDCRQTTEFNEVIFRGGWGKGLKLELFSMSYK